jgi:hypothetical protein
MSAYYFALSNPEAEALLKAELKLFYPELKPSYSRPGFFTFKAESEIVFRPYFARVAGRMLGKEKPEELSLEKLWLWTRLPEIEVPQRVRAISEQSRFRIGETVNLLMAAGPGDFWLGQYKLESTHFQTPGEVSSILEKEAPSRAYYKIAEAVEAFDLQFENEEKVLELGSAPGGATRFLLDQDLKVLGVDPADMDPKIKGHFNFKHLRMPFEHLTGTNVPPDIDWIVSDVNLPPTVVVKEVRRLLEFLSPRGLLLTLKINQEKHLPLLRSFERTFLEAGFNKVAIKYLPSHRQELCLAALREN